MIIILFMECLIFDIFSQSKYEETKFMKSD